MSDVINNGVKLVGETMLPGASLLLDGNLVNGAAHVAAGAAAAAFLAPWTVLLVVADSFSKSDCRDPGNSRPRTSMAVIFTPSQPN